MPAHLENVRVALHLMQADLKLTDVKRTVEYGKSPHLVAPVPWALSQYWTPQIVEKFFGCDGLVNKVWERHGIHLSLAGIEECRYPSEETKALYKHDPSLLRFDEPRRAQRDSIFIPETIIPWGTQLFRSINKLFTDERPDVLHVLIWWSVAETEFDRTAAQYKGYSRSAGRGGPAAWVSSRGCVQFDGSPGPDKDAECALLIAHEIGHALGLHHPEKGGDDPQNPTMGDVEEPDSNLMTGSYPVCDLEPWQEKRAQEEAKRRFNRR